MQEAFVTFFGGSNAEETVHQTEVVLELQFLVTHLVITGGADVTFLTEGTDGYLQAFPHLVDVCKQCAVS